MSSPLEIDLINRDPNELNHHVQVMFDDVLAEPEGIKSADCVWKWSFRCFSCSRNTSYKILSCLFGLPIAIFWGCLFGTASFIQIWYISPKIRCLHISCYSCRKIFSIFLGSCVGPCVEVYSLIFSRIHVTTSTGEAPKPLGFMPSGPSRLPRLDNKIHTISE